MYKTSRLKESEYEKAAELINSGGQLTWELNKERLKKKIGTGALYGLKHNDTLVGVIGVKTVRVFNQAVGELGYLYVDPNHRSFTNFRKLYQSLEEDPSHTMGFMTTRVDNRTINLLLSRIPEVELVGQSSSSYSNNKLNYWVVKYGDYKKCEELLINHYGIES